jgi:hypothetical protein
MDACCKALLIASVIVRAALLVVILKQVVLPWIIALEVYVFTTLRQYANSQ